MSLKKTVRPSKVSSQLEPTPKPADIRPPSTPTQLAGRWHWHPESIRRALRERRLASVIVGRRRLIPASEIDRIESEGFVTRIA